MYGATLNFLPSLIKMWLPGHIPVAVLQKFSAEPRRLSFEQAPGLILDAQSVGPALRTLALELKEGLLIP